MSSRDGIAHIERERKRSYCGRSLVMAFHLLDLTHAEACIKTESYVRPCKVCLRIARLIADKLNPPEMPK